jgi:hypothetical protein
MALLKRFLMVGLMARSLASVNLNAAPVDVITARFQALEATIRAQQVRFRIKVSHLNYSKMQHRRHKSRNFERGSMLGRHR